MSFPHCSLNCKCPFVSNLSDQNTSLGRKGKTDAVISSQKFYQDMRMASNLGLLLVPSATDRLVLDNTSDEMCEVPELPLFELEYIPCIHPYEEAFQKNQKKTSPLQRQYLPPRGKGSSMRLTPSFGLREKGQIGWVRVNVTEYRSRGAEFC